MTKLVDVTDRRVRRLQMAGVAGYATLLGIGVAMLSAESVPGLAAWGVLATALALLAVVASVRQRWEVEYKGHRVRFENSAVLAERLFLDGGLVARGGVGKTIEMRAPIRVGDGAGEEIVALSDAGLGSVRLRLFVEGADEVAPVSMVDAAEAAPTSRPTVDTATLGGFAVVKQTVEFLAAVIGLVGGAVALAGWLG